MQSKTHSKSTKYSSCHLKTFVLKRVHLYYINLYYLNSQQEINADFTRNTKKAQTTAYVMDGVQCMQTRSPAVARVGRPYRLYLKASIQLPVAKRK